MNRITDTCTVTVILLGLVLQGRAIDILGSDNVAGEPVIVHACSVQHNIVETSVQSQAIKIDTCRQALDSAYLSYYSRTLVG